MILVDPDQWESSQLNTGVTSTPKNIHLPEPVGTSISLIDQITSVKKIPLVESDQGESPQLTSVVTSTPTRNFLPEPIRPSVSPS